MKRNEANESIHRAIFFDTETTPIQLGPTEIGHTLRFGWGAYLQREKDEAWRAPQWQRFNKAKQFWEWVEGHARPKVRLYLFCHNAAFDLPVLDAFSELPKRGWHPSMIVVEGPPVIIVMRKGQATITLLDTLNIWRMPLLALGESIGFRKKPMPLYDAPARVWDDYCRNDVEVIMGAVKRWLAMLKERDFGGFAPTLAGQALRTYRHRFMDYPILIDNHKPSLECSRACYHGGRTEAWFIGAKREPFYLLDVNSMYPFVMREHAYPTKLVGYSRGMDVAGLRAALMDWAVCARVRLKTKRALYPVVYAGKLYFPVGEFDAALSTPELIGAVCHREIVGVYDAACYERHPIFRRFVDELYAMRQAARKAGDSVLAWQIKILMNSLYGKFGQRGYVYEDVGATDDSTARVWTEVNADVGDSETYRQIMGRIQRLGKEGEASQSHPAIAAHVTAYARVLLYHYAEKAGLEHVYYMDTDSLLVDAEGYAALKRYLHPETLGALKLEGEFPEIEIFGPKDYRFGDKVRTKGVKARAKWIGSNVVEQEQWSGFAGLLRQGRLNMPTTKTVRKTLTRRYDKGLVQPDGRVLPLVVDASGDMSFSLTAG